MTISALYKKLVAVYTRENLEAITAKIIALHRNRQQYAIDQMMRTAAGESKDRSRPDRSFYKLMMLFHPDRLAHHQAELKRYLSANDVDGLNTFAGIFPILDLAEQLKVSPAPAEAVTSSDEYRWEAPGSGFDYRDEPDDESQGDGAPASDFFSVFKRSVYGHENMELPFYYLEELGDLDMSGYGIESLDGLQHCVRLTVLDLARNNITDISELSRLPLLREVFLSGNRIGYIDALSFTQRLRNADLSGNDIDDISPLFTLPDLEYVNILGNRVPGNQIEELQKRGILVVS